MQRALQVGAVQSGFWGFFAERFIIRQLNTETGGWLKSVSVQLVLFHNNGTGNSAEREIKANYSQADQYSIPLW